ncbi:MAG: SAM-dependent methyltransferase [Hyphomicrobiaceae bacterium]|jgi:SAM-dependent methyltransferase
MTEYSQPPMDHQHAQERDNDNAALGLAKVPACPACGGEERTHRFLAPDPIAGGDFAISTCSGCGLNYVDPAPDPADMEAYYATCYYGGRHPILKDFFMGLRARKLGNPRGTRKVLDIGCGAGDFLQVCDRRGWKVTGIEQGDAPVMQLAEGHTAQVLSPERMGELPAGQFAAVTIWHVLEHVAHPRQVLAEARRVVADDGQLIIEVPHFGGWQASIGGARWFHLDVPRHLHHFDRDALVGLVERSGFTCERVETFSLEYDTYGLAQSLLNKLCRNPNHLFQKLIGHPTDGPARDTVLSLVLLPPLAIASAIVSAIAPLFGAGGVLRIYAKPS